MMKASPVNYALIRPRLKAGVSNRALGFTWGPAGLAAVMAGTSFGWSFAAAIVGLAMLVHAVLRWAFRRDERIFAIYARYSVLADLYQPHAREKLAAPFARPAGFARGLRL